MPGMGNSGIGGPIFFVLEAFLLFDEIFRALDIPEPSFQVRRWFINVTTGTLVVVLLSFMYFIMIAVGSETRYIFRSQEALVGQRGVEVADLAPSWRIKMPGRTI